MAGVGQPQGDGDDDDMDDNDKDDSDAQAARGIVMNVVKEALEGNRANELFGNLEQLLSDDSNTLDPVFSAINAAAKEAFTTMPVPEAMDAHTAIALVRNG